MKTPPSSNPPSVAEARAELLARLDDFISAARTLAGALDAEGRPRNEVDPADWALQDEMAARIGAAEKELPAIRAPFIPVAELPPGWPYNLSR